MSTNNDKTLILKGIKDYYNFKSDTEFSDFLGIKPTTLSSWYRRNTFDYDLLYSKCVEINPEFFFNKNSPISKHIKKSISEPETGYSGKKNVTEIDKANDKENDSKPNLQKNLSFNEAETGYLNFLDDNKNYHKNSNIFTLKPNMQKNVILLEGGISIKPFKLRTDKDAEMQVIPLYSLEATAGLVMLLDNPTQSNVIDYLSIPNLPNCDGALYVTGDSMYPLLKSGDIVAYKQVRDIVNDVFFGEMYVVSLSVSGEELVTVKYLQKSENKGFIRLVSHNQHHPDKEVSIDKINALALIKASIRYNMMY
jgi:phage repressor protein C with HTH and peptisase S24 domain